jgi:hypothetical protein
MADKEINVDTILKNEKVLKEANDLHDAAQKKLLDELGDLGKCMKELQRFDD